MTHLALSSQGCIGEQGKEYLLGHLDSAVAGVADSAQR
jgi:hypothetical protein